MQVIKDCKIKAIHFTKGDDIKIPTFGLKIEQASKEPILVPMTFREFLLLFKYANRLMNKVFTRSHVVSSILRIFCIVASYLLAAACGYILGGGQ